MLKFGTSAKLAAVAAALLLAACASKKPAEVAPPVAASETIAPGSARDFEVNVGDRVFFDYDRYDLDGNDQATLQKQAAWLNKYPSVMINVEGHCDERGTREYNLALGARRANSVKEFLASLGVSRSRMETISYGKEKPTCVESNEACWAQNRRGVSLITGGTTS